MTSERPFEGHLRILDEETLEWDDRESFLVPTQRPRTAPEVFLVLTNPSYGLGLHLSVSGRVEYYRCLLEWAGRKDISNGEIVDTVKELGKKHGAVQVPPMVALEKWLEGIHMVISQLQGKRVVYSVDEKSMTFRMKEPDGFTLN
jgi:hypothetical protein